MPKNKTNKQKKPNSNPIIYVGLIYLVAVTVLLLYHVYCSVSMDTTQLIFLD